MTLSVRRPTSATSAPLRLIVALGAAALTFQAVAQTAAAWKPDVYYTAGTVVSYNGQLYRATVNQTDYASTGWNPTNASLWTLVGPASGPAPSPAPSPAPTPSPSPSPAPAPTPAPSPAPAPQGAWNAATAYSGGAIVSYQGVIYRANWWTQGDNPATQSGPVGTGKPWTVYGGTTPPAPSPAPTPTPAPAPTPSPAPGPAPTPAPSPGPAPAPGKHQLIGYWHNFTNPAGPTFPISQVSADYDVIVVAFADDAGNGSIAFNLDPSAGGEARFIADVAAARSKGKKVVLSFGGQNGTVTLNNASQVTNFVNSVEAIMKRYGFDGIDIDLESGAGVTSGAPVQANLVSAVKQLKQRIGSGFYLSMAPEHPYVQGGFVAYSGIWGAYLPIIDGLRDELNVLHVQYYNNGAVYTPYATQGLAEGSVDMLVATSRMLIEGFTTNNGTGPFVFRGLRPDQVAFGLPSGPSSANSGQASVATITAALNCLTKLSQCGAIKPAQAYPTFRGVMTWSINWDSHDGKGFSTGVRASLNALP
jgi:chitinase